MKLLRKALCICYSLSINGGYSYPYNEKINYVPNSGININSILESYSSILYNKLTKFLMY